MFWKRVARSSEASPNGAEVAELEQAAREVATQRLGRLVARQREDEAVAALPQGDAAANIARHFGQCAFLQLDVAMAASASDIHRAVDDMSFAEDVDPQTLSRAQAELLSPRDRLEHELSWLPGSDSDFQRRAVAAVKAGDCEELATLRFSASGLARINLGCTLLAASPGDIATITHLLNDLPRWKVHDTHAAVDEARFNAGLRPVEPSHFDEAVSNRLGAIAGQLANAVSGSREGRMALATAIADNAEAIRQASNPALEAVLVAYGRTVDPQLQNLQSKMAEAIASLKANPLQPAQLTSIITMLDLWSQIRLPLQRLEQARGLDDPLSAQLFGELRDLGLELANSHNLQTETLRLTRATKHAFSSVPGLQPLIERDLPTIMGNVLSGQMLELVKATLKNLGRFCAEIRAYGFEPGAGEIGARLIDCFEQWHEAQPDAEEPFVLFREISIAVNNKQAAPLLALKIIEWLLEQRPPAAIAAQLTQDMCKLHSNINRKK